MTYLLAVLAGFHLAVPVSIVGWSHGLTMFLAALTCAAGVIAGCLYLARAYYRGLTEATMLLTSLGFGCLAVSTIPSSSEDLAIRYPTILAATMVGFCAASFLWGWLYGVWQQQLKDGGLERNETSSLWGIKKALI